MSPVSELDPIIAHGVHHVNPLFQYFFAQKDIVFFMHYAQIRGQASPDTRTDAPVMIRALHIKGILEHFTMLKLYKRKGLSFLGSSGGKSRNSGKIGCKGKILYSKTKLRMILSLS